MSRYRLLISGQGCKTLGNDSKNLSVGASMFYTKQLRCIPKIVSVFDVPFCITVKLFFGGPTLLALCQKFASQLVLILYLFNAASYSADRD